MNVKCCRRARWNDRQLARPIPLLAFPGVDQRIAVSMGFGLFAAPGIMNIW
jgi:hypothetical protein